MFAKVSNLGECAAMLPLIDMSTVKQLSELSDDGNPNSLLVELVAVFSSTIPARLNSMRAAVAARDLKVLRFEAHTMKSAGGNIGAARFAAICQTVEDMQDFGEAGRALQLVEQVGRESEHFVDAVTALVGAAKVSDSK